MYADTDFFIALLKEADWLKQRAEHLYAAHKADIWTSTAAMIEVLYKAAERGIDIEEAVGSLTTFCEILPLAKEHLLLAAQIKKQNPQYGTMDCIHASVALYSGEKKVLSSDKKIYERLGFERIKLER